MMLDSAKSEYPG